MHRIGCFPSEAPRRQRDPGFLRDSGEWKVVAGRMPFITYIPGRLPTRGPDCMQLVDLP